jgi:uncharacterized protein YqeY
MGSNADAEPWKHALRTELVLAMRRGDKPAVRALRTTIAAIENAEAIEGPEPTPGIARSPIAGSVEIASAQTPRRDLSHDEVRAIIDAEIEERRRSAETYERAGHVDRATGLRLEADVLRSFVERYG